MTDKMKILERFIDIGWKIFPVYGMQNGLCNCDNSKCSSPGKHPRTKHGLKDASGDIVTIRGWDSKFPKANWAVRTGKESEILVADVDIKNGGLDNWEELLTIKNSDIEPNVKTPTGGHHYYFRLKLGQEFTNSSGSLPEGIDIRANGGYVILPEVSNNYEQLKSFEDIREIPDWVVKHVVQKRENPISIIAKTSKIPVGNRNPTLFKESCALRRRGWEREELLNAIYSLNDSRTEEPLEKSEVLDLVNSSLKYKTDLPLAGISEQDGLIKGIDLLNMDIQEPDWTVPNFLPIGLSILGGKSKVGKSWLALQLSKAVASGEKTFGYQAMKGKVLFLALEDSKSRIKKRLKMQGWDKETIKNIDFYFLNGFQEDIGKLQKGGSAKLANIIEKHRYQLVVIDTYGKAIYGDHNNYNEMTCALTPIQSIAFEIGCSIIFIDHHKKNSGDNPDAILDIQGSTAKGAIADSLIGLYSDKSSSSGTIFIESRDMQERRIEANFNSFNGMWIYKKDEGELNMTERRIAIINAIKDLEIAQIQDIADNLGLDKSNIHASLQELASVGQIVRLPIDKNVYYFLPDTTESIEEIESRVRREIS